MPARAHPAAVAHGAENVVELLHADFRDRVVLVDDDHEVVLPSHVVVRAGEDRDAERLVALHAQVAEVVVEAGLVIDTDVRQSQVHARYRDRRRRQVVFDLDTGLEFFERFLPPAAQWRIADVVVAADAQFSDRLFFRHVVGQAGEVELSGVGRCAGPRLHPRLALGCGARRQLLRFLGGLRLR